MVTKKANESTVRRMEQAEEMLLQTRASLDWANRCRARCRIGKQSKTLYPFYDRLASHYTARIKRIERIIVELTELFVQEVTGV